MTNTVYKPMPWGFRPAHADICPTCDGCGETQVEDYDDCSTFWRKVTCGGCNGTGFAPACGACYENAADLIDDDNNGWCQRCFNDRAVCWVCGADAVDVTLRFCGAACEAEWVVTQAEEASQR